MSKQLARQRSKVYHMKQEPWKLEEVLQTTEVPDMFLAFIEARAIHDYHYNQVNNGYQQGTREHSTYNSKIKELMENAHAEA